MLYEKEEKEEIVKIEKVHLSKDTMVLLLSYGLSMGLVCVGMNNGILTIEQALASRYEASKKVLIYSYIMTASRLIRVLGNLFFQKVTRILKEKQLLITIASLMMSFICFIIGDYFDFGFLSVILVALEYYIIIFIRDGNKNLYYKMVLNTCKQEQYNKAYSSLINASNIANVCFTAFAALCLQQFDYRIFMIALLAVSCISLIPTLKSYQIVQKK